MIILQISADTITHRLSREGLHWVLSTGQDNYSNRDFFYRPIDHQISE